jgi:predicted amidohydrolase YtcJ
MGEVLRRPRSVLLRDVEVDGLRRDVWVDGGRVAAVGSGLRVEQAEVDVDGRGGVLLPGLHDHHVHLLATAATRASVRCGPPDVHDREALRRALRSAPGSGWVRGRGYHERVAGPLSRALLDDVAPGRPVRVQHRTGALWALNTRALRELGAHAPADGVLWRGDPRLRSAPQESSWPDLRELGDELARSGVLGVTDATPDLAPAALARIEQARLPQDVLLLGAPDEGYGEDLRPGPWKVLLHDEGDLDVPRLVEVVRRAHAVGRAVALHTVTRASLVAVLTALSEAGSAPGDRLEHCGVLPPELVGAVAALGVAVVTQPALAAAHGDDHLRDVDPQDHQGLWPYASLLAAGIRTAPSTDSPHGPGDVWQVLRAASDRRTPSGRVANPRERVPVETALAGLLSPLTDPGGPPRRVAAGAIADLVLLEVPLADALQEPSCDLVRLVLSAR